MSLPTATYRIQFRNGMTFDRAVELIPHLQSLGISHVYASPIFAATKGSTHGYDIVDPNVVEPEIGGREGFDRLSSALKQARMGLIIDIVPNHLAASLENPWWRDVIERGKDSRFAGYFDIDWQQKLTLPVIGHPVEEELRDGNLKLAIDADNAALSIDYFGSRYPLHPDTYRDVLAHLEQPLSGEMVPLKDSAILDMQPWKFIPWYEAQTGLSYRRFFEITGLVGVKVEDEEVFDAVHRTIFDMVRRGQVDGLRVDHIDGLADPEAYLMRLREKAGPDVYIVVEKILEKDEQLPQSWPVNGTTGYEFIASLADLLVKAPITTFEEAYSRAAPDFADPEAALQKAKELMAGRNFRGEVSALERIAGQIAAAEGGVEQSAVQVAVSKLLTAFPVYRTYGSPRGLAAEDENLLAEIFEGLNARASAAERSAFYFLHKVLRGDVGDAQKDTALRFRTRMQHLTGPLLAKALEDTFFYRYNRLLGLNEVGGDPLTVEGSIERFHGAMRVRQERQPTGLTATSTHDTKRAEDGRARLYALTEAPDLWLSAQERWREMNKAKLVALPEGPAPEPNVEWMLYQALAGVWPPELDISDAAALDGLRDRFLPYVEKSLREAKLRTDWSNGSEDYEAAVKAYAEWLLSPDNTAFLSDFSQSIAPFIEAGFANSLSQTLLKLTVPGIPDIYQGCEGFDFSLVDPDNRRMPDYAAIAEHPVARRKSEMISRVLKLRMDNPSLFEKGSYEPLEVQGAKAGHVVAFCRALDGEFAIVAVPRHCFGAADAQGNVSEGFWGSTAIKLPASAAGSAMRELFSNVAIEGRNGTIQAAKLFADQPFALAIAQ